MKHRKHIGYGALAAVMLLIAVSCSEFSDFIGDGGVPVNLTASADSTLATAMTRAADGLYTAATGFDGNEQVKVFMNTIAKNGIYDVGASYDDGGLQKSNLTVATGSSPVSLPTDDDGSATIFSVFPATSAEEHTVKYDQVSNANYKQSDLMFASTTVTWATALEKYALKPNLPFTHQMVKLKLTVVKAADVSQINEVKMQNVKRTVSVEPSAEGITFGTPTAASDGLGNQILLSSGEASSSSEQSYTYCCVFPAQAWDDGNGGATDFIAIKADGGTAVYRLQRDAWMPGHEYTLTLNLNTFLLGMTATLKNWDDNQYTVTINPTAADGGTLTVAHIDDATYTGSAIVPDPAPAVSFGATTLTPGTDYDLIYYNNTNVGTALIVAQGKGTYAGQIGIGSFNIVSKDLSSGSIAPVADQIYNGVGIEPALNVYANDGTLLVKNTDYIVTYEANVNVGTATINVTATPGGNYTGSLSTTFNILPRSLSTFSDFFIITFNPATQIFTGSTLSTTVASVVDNGLATQTPYTMVSTTDYTVSGQTSGTDKGTYTVTITGQGNYCDTKTATWAITIAPCTVETAPTAKTYVYDASVKELINTGTAGPGGTMYYGMPQKGKNIDKGDLTLTTSPTATLPDRYYIWYYVKADDANHSDSKILGPIISTISKRPVTLTAKDASVSMDDLDKTYDVYSGKTYSGLTPPTGAKPFTGYVTPSAPDANSGLVSGHYVSSIKLKPGISSIGSGPLTPSNAVIKDAGGNDVTKNYEITYVDGTLTITDPGVPLASSQLLYRVGSNGKAYAPSSNLPQGVSVVGMVVHKSGSNGIVMAKENVENRTFSQAKAYSSSAGSFYVSNLSSKESKTWICGSKTQYENILSNWDNNMINLSFDLEGNGCDSMHLKDMYWSSTNSSSGGQVYSIVGWFDNWDPSYQLPVRPIFAF